MQHQAQAAVRHLEFVTKGEMVYPDSSSSHASSTPKNVIAVFRAANKVAE